MSIVKNPKIKGVTLIQPNLPPQISCKNGTAPQIMSPRGIYASMPDLSLNQLKSYMEEPTDEREGGETANGFSSKETNAGLLNYTSKITNVTKDK